MISINEKDKNRLIIISEQIHLIEKSMNRFGNDLSAFLTDQDYQDTICMKLFYLSETVVQLSEDFKESTAGEIPWFEIKGLRNLFAHSYGKINPEQIWFALKEDLPTLTEFCQKYLK